MINSRMRVIEEYRRRKLATTETAGVVAQLHLKEVRVVAGSFACWISPYAGDATDGKLFRRVEVVGCELAAQVEGKPQVVGNALQAIKRVGELVVIAISPCRGGVDR